MGRQMKPEGIDAFISLGEVAAKVVEDLRCRMAERQRNGHNGGSSRKTRIKPRGRRLP